MSYQAIKLHEGILNAYYQVKEANLRRLHEGYILYDSNYRTFWKRQNYGDSKRVSGCQGLRKEGQIGGAQRIFQAVKLFCMTL